MGGKITPCIFKHKDSEDKNVLILSSYPPSESVPTAEHENRTSNEIQKIMQGFRFVWEDSFPFAPDRNNDVDQKLLLKLVRDVFYLLLSD